MQLKFWKHSGNIPMAPRTTTFCAVFNDFPKKRQPAPQQTNSMIE